MLTVIGLSVTVWSSGRLFRERKALKEEMDLYVAWKQHPGAALLHSHIQEQLALYLHRARRRERRLRRLLMELLAVLAVGMLALALLAVAVGNLDVVDVATDPETIALLIIGATLVVVVQRILRWWDGWQFSREQTRS